jgi:DNA-binding LacI/PurR family transcriptional regulator
MSQNNVPQRATLVSQTVAILERGLREGRWPGELPGQHALCDQLVISRTTLRAALQDLARRKLISLRQGASTLVHPRFSRASAQASVKEVIVLLPEPLWLLRPSVARWAGELGPLLQRSGLEMRLSGGRLYYGRRPEARLEKLIRMHPRSAWVLFASTEGMQRWFAARQLPVVLVGSAFPRINLPSIEYDHAAIAQHAMVQFTSAGHRQTAILLQHTGSAADDSTRNAFGAALPAGYPPPLVLEHDGSLAQIHARLVRLSRVTPRPTALFITKSLSLPAVLTILPRLGMEIPRDLSVICREDDIFTEYLVPAVARYRSDSSAIARKLAVALRRLAAGEALKLTHDRLMPHFVAGQSIRPPA